jgi:hypothetical protein
MQQRINWIQEFAGPDRSAPAPSFVLTGATLLSDENEDAGGDRNNVEEEDGRSHVHAEP